MLFAGSPRSCEALEIRDQIAPGARIVGSFCHFEGDTFSHTSLLGVGAGPLDLGEMGIEAVEARTGKSPGAAWVLSATLAGVRSAARGRQTVSETVMTTCSL